MTTQTHAVRLDPATPWGGRVPYWSIGDRMRKARESAGLSQTELSEAAGISRKTISRIEAEGMEPKRAYLIAWSFATGVALEWLETGESPRPVDPDGGSECAIRDSNPEPAD